MAAGQIPWFLLSEPVLVSGVCPLRSPSAQAAEFPRGAEH